MLSRSAGRLRPHVHPPEYSLLPWLYCTKTIARGYAEYSPARPSSKGHVPFEGLSGDGRSDQKPLGQDVFDQTTITPSERRAFEGLLKLRSDAGAPPPPKETGPEEAEGDFPVRKLVDPGERRRAPKDNADRELEMLLTKNEHQLARTKGPVMPRSLRNIEEVRLEKEHKEREERWLREREFQNKEVRDGHLKRAVDHELSRMAHLIDKSTSDVEVWKILQEQVLDPVRGLDLESSVFSALRRPTGGFGKSRPSSQLPPEERKARPPLPPWPPGPEPSTQASSSSSTTPSPAAEESAQRPRYSPFPQTSSSEDDSSVPQSSGLDAFEDLPSPESISDLLSESSEYDESSSGKMQSTQSTSSSKNSKEETFSSRSPPLSPTGDPSRYDQAPKKKEQGYRPSEAEILPHVFHRHIDRIAQTLAKHFPGSPLSTAVLPTLKAMGPLPFALGASTSLYNTQIRQVSLQYGPHAPARVLELCEEMDRAAYKPDGATLYCLGAFLNEARARRSGDLGQPARVLWRTDMMERNFLALSKLHKEFERKRKRQVLLEAELKRVEQLHASGLEDELINDEDHARERTRLYD